MAKVGNKRIEVEFDKSEMYVLIPTVGIEKMNCSMLFVFAWMNRLAVITYKYKRR